MKRYAIGDIYSLIDEIAPFHLAEEWDNAGLLLGGKGDPVTKALLALDATPEVVEEAEAIGADLLVTHHPVIFRPVKRIGSGELAYRLIRRGIGVISAHTNLDAAAGGVNDCLAQILGLEEVRPLNPAPIKRHNKIVVFVPEKDGEAVYRAMASAGAGVYGAYKGCAFLSPGEGRFLPAEGAHPAIGQVGTLEKVREARLEMLVEKSRTWAVLEAMRGAHPYEVPAFDVLEEAGVEYSCIARIGTADRARGGLDFAAFVKDRLQAEAVAYVDGKHPVRCVAVAGGAGADLLYEAKAAGADALVTAEAKHHQMLDAAGIGLTLVDAGHFYTERVVLGPLRQSMAERLPGLEISVSQAMRPPHHFV